jgi:hypothetical protein
VSVDPKPSPSRKPPVFLAVRLRVSVGFGTFAPGLSCPFTGDEAFASGTGLGSGALRVAATDIFFPTRAKRFWSSVISS